VLRGEQRFHDIGCASCHIPRLPLSDQGWVFTEPNPYNPSGNLQPGDAPTYSVDLTSDELPGPRLKPRHGIVWVPAFTDLKLHDISSGSDGEAEPLDMQSTPGSPAFFLGNSRFLTRKLWGIANEPPFFHHGQFTTMRQAVLAHAGEAATAAAAFRNLSAPDKNAVIEFLKSLQVLPPGADGLVVDERGRPRAWPH
jgi:cytochrome c peroxidase